MRNGIRVLGITLCVGTVVALSGCDVLTVKPTFEVKLAVPAELSLREAFALGVDISNPHGSAITLDSVDVDNALLKAFQVVSVEPTPTDTMHVPLLDQRSWSFGKSVPARGAMRVTFNLRPLQLGRVSGKIEACNPGQDCASAFADLVVGPKRP